ncbi:MAG TPA: DNA translocase FtsK, partial [Lachnospiraceae bacterium]|nr:DNA translocase FtsK [Lachnospiraceae bacterium]
FGEKQKAAAVKRNHKPAEITDIREEISHRERSGKHKNYQFPPVTLLKKGNINSNVDSTRQLKETAARLQQTLGNFGVHVTITDISQGPTVTRYEMQPEQGVKVSKIVSLTDDIKLNMAATDIRIEAPIPGKAAVGIEIPNKENSTVMFRDLIESSEFRHSQAKLSFAVGKDISGQIVVTDIAKMPHLLIAGATGSGKSVCINTLIMSILYKTNPDDVKLIMVDPKVVELSIYNGIPHLMIPVVTDPKKAASALHWGVSEMTDRYNKFAELGVRDLKGYNKKIETMQNVPEEERQKKLPQVIIIVDELADLMMVASNEVEESICRLAQLARAAGIHLIIATQRPSVDVITGLIKANMPSRIAFSVSSGVDSRTILDMNGAEKLLGKGDMLFYPQGYAKPARIQGAFISDQEVSDVVDFLKDHTGGEGYRADIEEKITSGIASASFGAGAASDRDQYFTEAAKFIIDKDKASIGMLQRVFKIGFNRAARIMDQLAEAGVVGEEEGTKPRKVLMSMEQFEQFMEDSL